FGKSPKLEYSKTDEYAFVGNRSAGMYVAERKRPGLGFITDQHPADVFNQAPHEFHEGEIERGKHTCNTMAQLLTYMVIRTEEGEVGRVGFKFGYFSDWDSWCFCKHAVENGDEVLYVSRWFKRNGEGADSARLAYAYFLHMTVSAMVSGDVFVPLGN